MLLVGKMFLEVEGVVGIERWFVIGVAEFYLMSKDNSSRPWFLRPYL
jgi:hypothetical protein